jgi:O-antigen/teichoic acid export membrane protein
VEAPKVVHIALLGALFPAMSQAHAQATGGREHAPFGSAFSLSAGGLFAIATLAAIALFFFAEPIILLLYGGRFAQAAIALKILCWALIPFTASQYIATKFLAQGREKQVVIALFASIAVLFTLTIWALPRWGIGGAAWAVLFAEAAQAGVFLFLQKRRGA